MSEHERKKRYGKAIWEASRADEGTISATGADHVASAVMVVADEEQETLRRGGHQLGRIVDRQCRDVLDATGLHHLINKDGDGDWALVWERLAELRPRLERAETEIDMLRDQLAALAPKDAQDA